MSIEFRPKLLNTLIQEALYYPKVTNIPEGRDTGVGFGMALFGLVIALKAKNVVELGVRGGGTAYPLLLGTYLTGGTLTSVDIEECDVSWADNIDTPGVTDNWNVVKQDAIKFLEEYDKEIDLIFIDDWHECSHVMKELELVKDKISPSGLITMHDAMYQNWEPKYHENMSPICPRFGEEFGNGGVYRALKDFTAKYPNEWEFCTIPVDHGFTILRKLS